MSQVFFTADSVRKFFAIVVLSSLLTASLPFGVLTARAQEVVEPTPEVAVVDDTEVNAGTDPVDPDAGTDGTGPAATDDDIESATSTGTLGEDDDSSSVSLQSAPMMLAAVALDPFPSTNENNKSSTSSRPHVNLLNSAPGTVTLEFRNDTNSQAFFEVRTDGVVADPSRPLHYNPCKIGAEPLNGACNGKRYLEAEERYYAGGVSVDNRSGQAAPTSTVTRTFSANSSIEIRLALGGERNWDFDWVSFAVPAPKPEVVTTEVITPADLKGWTIEAVGGGDTRFVENATAPLGIGNVKLVSDAQNSARAGVGKQVTASLKDLKGLSYQTKQNAANTEAGNASYRISFDADGDLGTSNDRATLIYEPYWQNDKSPDSAPIVPGVWQTWDVDNGFFWASVPGGSAAYFAPRGVTNGAGGHPFFTLSEIKAWYPDAVVTWFGTGIGSYNPLHDIDVDRVVFGTESATEITKTVYDFDPVPSTYSSNTTVVTLANMQGWEFNSDRDTWTMGPASLVEGPTPTPLGTGSAMLGTATDNDRTKLRHYVAADISLADITALSYSTYRTGTSTGIVTAPALQLDVQFTHAATVKVGRIVYEPYFNGAVSNDTWQNWDARAGKWWIAGVSGLAACTQGHATSCTWSELLTNYPDIRTSSTSLESTIDTQGAVLFKAGGSWGDFTGYVDNLVMGIKTGNNVHTETYDFEVEVVTPPPTTSGGGGGGSRSSNPTPQVLGASTDEELYQLLEAIKQRLIVLLAEERAANPTPIVPGTGSGQTWTPSAPATSTSVTEDEEEVIETDETDTPVAADEEETDGDDAGFAWQNLFWVFVMLWMLATAAALWWKSRTPETIAMRVVQGGFAAAAILLLAAYFIGGLAGAFWPGLIVAIGAITTYFWTVE